MLKTVIFLDFIVIITQENVKDVTLRGPDWLDGKVPSGKTSNQFARRQKKVKQGQIWRFLDHSLSKNGQKTVKISKKWIFVKFLALKSRWKESFLNFLLLNHEAQSNSYEAKNDDF